MNDITITRKCRLIVFLLTILYLMRYIPVSHGDSPYILDWGNQGEKEGEFTAPYAVTIGPSGYVYVVDRNNHRIQVFNSTGHYISQFGAFGTEEGLLIRPMDIAINSMGQVFVADGNNHRIQVFNSSYDFINTWGAKGEEDGQFLYPRNIAIDSSDRVYVADSGNQRIQVFDFDGNFLRKWGTNGTANGEFKSPRNVAIDSFDQVYVADRDNQRIQVFDFDGNFLRKWGTSGTGDGEFNWPRGVAIDSTGNVYVADSKNHRIQIFDSNGKFKGKLGRRGSGIEEMIYPVGIGVDASNYIYVGDRGNNRIQKYKIYGVSVECLTKPQTIIKGKEVIHQFKINNTGYVEDIIDISYSGRLVGELNREQLILSPGESMIVNLTLSNPPSGFGQRSGVIAVSEGSSGMGVLTSDEDVALTYVKVYGITLHSDNTLLKITEGEDIVHLINITNIGNAADIFNLTYYGDINCTLSDENITLAAGESKLLKLAIKSPPKGTDYEVNIVAVSNSAAIHDTSVSEEITLMINVESPNLQKMKWVILYGLLSLALITCIVIYFKYLTNAI